MNAREALRKAQSVEAPGGHRSGGVLPSAKPVAGRRHRQRAGVLCGRGRFAFDRVPSPERARRNRRDQRVRGTGPHGRLEEQTALRMRTGSPAINGVGRGGCPRGIGVSRGSFRAATHQRSVLNLRGAHRRDFHADSGRNADWPAEARGDFRVPPDFNAPLPEQVLRDFEGA